MDRHTCFLMYNTTTSGLADERYIFTNPLDNNTVNKCTRNSMYPDMCATGLGKYLLRPETIESMYVMYSKTKNPIFREWGWKIWTTIRDKCRGTYGFGDYNGVNGNGNVEDRAETWFFSETIKYLYLLFAEEGPTYLDEYVFNTEAHPIPRQK